VKEKQQALAEQLTGSRQEDIDQARAQVTQALGNLQTIRSQLNDTVVRAPFDGVVTKKYADPGAFVAPTTAGSAVSSATSSSILSLASPNQVVADVAETNIPQIRLGQKVTIRADAYSGKTFEGRVVEISPQSTVEQNVTSFEVKASLLSDSQNLLRSGMNVDVEVETGRLQNALVIPTVAIVRQPNVTGVYVEGKNQSPSLIPIVTGITINDKTEVRSGLKGTERVFISFPEGKRPRSSVPSPGQGAGVSRPF
jgi:HlyD family secretion protein